MASQSTKSTDGPVTLHFQDITRVAGETITGCVDLNVALAQEDHLEHLRIKFKGTIHSKITTTSGETTTDHCQTIILFKEKIPLWDQGAAFPEPGSHILSCPFQFMLPENLPPSFHCQAYHRRSTISYALEVNQPPYPQNHLSHSRRPSQSQLLAKESLKQGWNGPWRDITKEEQLRRGIFGDYSHARVKLTIPDMPSYPIATEIPFSFRVETETKLMHVSDAPVDKHGKPLFPAPPALSSDVRLSLHRRAEIRVRRYTRHVDDDFRLNGSLGDVTRVAAVHQVSDEPEWIPACGPNDKKGHGIWKRAIHFQSAVAIPYAPTSRTEIIDWHYNLLVVVPFPGIGNDLRLEVPLDLHPGSACPPPPIGTPGSSSITYADVLPAGPPPVMLDLPPSYWTGEHHAWDADEKS
ncbi:Arrestin-N domain-containing protein [Mycena venus]|uniref:Arrestin-N domain-containing protein n=1 Tax=Mycena venus TaxID=2733690 RepID=A0A8H6YPV2_9AGAR|nr:Arrestin-N domain-containing protein [Mycena venus]